MPTYQAPGVYREFVFPPPPEGQLRTGVPVFLGLIGRQALDAYAGQFSLKALPSSGMWLVKSREDPASTGSPEAFTVWKQVDDSFRALASQGYLFPAVRGFFENGGNLCYVQLVCFDAGVSANAAFRAGLETLMPLDTIDLVCAPDIMWPQHASELIMELDEDRVADMQLATLEHCELRGDRFAILDSLPGASEVRVGEQRNGLSGDNGALYYPWVRVEGVRVEAGSEPGHDFVPPAGHVAGIYARADARVGVHKAPANEVLQGVVDLEVRLSSDQQSRLNPQNVNCIRAFPGRGIRVWGARTLSNQPAWVYINVRRLFLTAGRWIERAMVAASFEPNDARLWARISRELTAYFEGLYDRGALKGRSPAEAFYVKCDAETNSQEVIDNGQVIVEIGLAPALPNEFVVIRIIHQEAGVTVVGPTHPA